MNNTTDVQTANDEVIELLRKAVKGNDEITEPEFKDVKVVREGNQITLPKGMTYKTAREWLTKKEKAEEKVIAIHHEINCYPLDGALALSRALKAIYGFTELQDTPGMFGSSNPPTMISVPVGVNQFENVAWGRVQPPGISGYLATGFDGTKLPTFILRGEVKRKDEEKIKAIIKTTEEFIRTQSIYKGKAVRVDLSYIDDSEVEFDPTQDAPKFMDVTEVKEDDIILNQNVEFHIQSSIWGRIRNTEFMKKQGIPIKHGVLLAGEYGTGKTMAAQVTAAIAEQNGWTFLYLKDAAQLAAALRFAQLYAPAVLFAEDIDKVVEGHERTYNMNEILNTLDGVDTKSSPIITVLTTNHPEKMNPAFIRAGRIDTVIQMEAPNEAASIKFVKKFAKHHLGKIDEKQVGEAFKGVVPAFINEAVQRAKLYVISRSNGQEDLSGTLTTEDLLKAAASQKSHIEMVSKKAAKTEAEHLQDSVSVVGKALLN